MAFTLDDLTPDRLAIFWSRVMALPNGCWVWTGAFDKNIGFPSFRVGRSFKEGAHRISYAIATGKHPGARSVTQTCKDRTCVRPSHLILGRPFTIDDSISRLAISKERKRQLRKQRAGICVKPRCTHPLAGSNYCKTHMISERERQRERMGSIERYDSMSYHL